MMRARGESGARDVVFNSRDTVDDSRVDDFGSDLRKGVDTVLRALQEYVSAKAGPRQGSLDVT